MATSDPLTAVIHFIGIITFTTQLSSDNHLQAIVPRIEASTQHTAPAANTTVARRQRPTRPGSARHVEEHAAFIAFPAGNYISSSGWPPVAMETVPGMLFVRLDGERVSFVPKPAYGDRGLALTEAVDAQAPALQLPHLQKSCCTTMTALSSQFQPPDFPGAAAVFDLPHGTAGACRVTAGGFAQSRVDTRLRIKNHGGLTITVTNGETKKVIELVADATVYVGNLPSQALDGNPTVSISAPHYMAYYRMGDGAKSCSSFACARENLDVPLCSMDSPFPVGIAGDTTIVMPRRGRSLIDIFRIDFECSNTQWP